MRKLAVLLLAVVPYSVNAQATPKPAAVVHTIDTGWWSRAHWLAAAFDSSTMGECMRHPGCYETDPVARAFIGNKPSEARLAVSWFGESMAVSKIQNVRLRRAVQIAAVIAHVSIGVRNIRRMRQ